MTKAVLENQLDQLLQVGREIFVYKMLNLYSVMSSHFQFSSFQRLLVLVYTLIKTVLWSS